jgi:syntaxin-binding protein 1
MNNNEEEFLSSRHEPALQSLLEAHQNNTVDNNVFPYTKPPLDLGMEQAQPSATSLRSAKPTWAKTRTNVSAENRQRVIVFMAGGSTYAEARSCYEVGRSTGREVFLVTSHMLTPTLFLRQVQDLSADKRRLGIPADQPKQQAPAHLFEPDEVPKPTPPPQQPAQRPAPVGPRPPEQQMANMNLNGSAQGRSSAPQQQPQSQYVQANSSAKLTKDREKYGEKEKKRHHFGFGRKDKY